MRTALVVLITLMFAPQGVADTKKPKRVFGSMRSTHRCVGMKSVVTVKGR